MVDWGANTAILNRLQNNTGRTPGLYRFGLLPLALTFLLAGSCSSPESSSRTQVAAIFKMVNALPENNERQIQVLDSAFCLIHKPGLEDKLDVYAFKCAFYQRRHDFVRASRYADSILDLAARRISNVKFAQWYASALASKGDIYLALKNYDESFKCYTKSRVISEKISTDTCGARSNYTQRLADLMYKQKKFADAATYFKLAIEERNCGTVSNEFLTFVYLQANYDNVGLCYARMHRWDSAVHYFNAALRYIGANEHRFPTRKDYIEVARAVVWGNLAGYYAQNNDAAQAESLYLKSLAVFNGRNDKFAQNLQLELADMYTRNKRFPEAGALLKQVRDSLQTLPDDNNLLKYYQVMSDSHVRMGEPAASVTYLERYIAARDSINEVNRRFASMSIDTEMDKRYQEELNEALAKDNRLKQLYLVVAVLLIVIIVVFFAFLLYNSKKQSALKRKLDLQNERQRISKELHDDLGSSLTALQIMLRRIMRQTKESEQNEILNNAAVVSEELIDQMSEIVWMLNDTTDTINGLFASLRTYMAGYIEKTGLPLSLDFRKNCPDDQVISSLQRRNLMLTLKEVFHNVVKHSGAGTFSMEWSCMDKKIEILASDDGIGFDLSASSAGNGLRNMQKRIADIGGSIAITQQRGTGIRIVFPPKN